MLYENYERKIQRRFKYKRIVFRHRILLIAIATVFSVLLLTFLTTKGLPYGISYESNVEYGDTYDISAKGIFSDISYEYKALEDSNWTNKKPVLPGNYQVRLMSNKVFNKNNGKILTFTINKKNISPFLLSDEVEFGNNPLPEINLVNNDRIESVYYEFEDITAKKTKIKLRELIIYNEHNVDVTSYYNVDFTEKIVTFIPRKVTLAPSEFSVVYNDQSFTNVNHQVLSGSIVEGHQVILETEGSIVNVGSTTNTITKVTILDDNNNDVTDNYEIDTKTSKINVLKRDLALELEDSSKEYDNTKLTSNTLKDINELELLDGHKVTVEANGFRIDVGSNFNTISNVIIFDSNNKDVTSNYNIIKVSGLLIINKRKITFKTFDATKVYDGLNLTNDKLEIVSGSLAIDHTYGLPKLFTITDVSNELNKLDVEIFDKDNRPVTFNYEVTYDYGWLEVTKRPITIESNSTNLIYNGRYQSHSSFNIIDDKYPIIQNHEVSIDKISQEKDVIKFENILTVNIKDKENFKTDNYEITYSYGEVNILKRDITIKPKDVFKEYDNTIFNSSTSEANISLVSNHEVSLITFGSIIDVGTTVNTIDQVTIKDENKNDVTNNYNITTLEGILEVTKRVIHIGLVDSIFTYDGAKHSSVLTNDLDDKLLKEHKITATTSLLGVNVGEYINTIEDIVINNLDGLDVTSNYQVTKLNGILTINKRDLLIETSSKTFLYEDKYFYDQTFNTDLYGLANNETFIVDNSTGLKEAGYASNEFDNYKIINLLNEDITFNYNVSFVYGTLEVLLREITIKPIDKTKVYDGFRLSSLIDEYELTNSLNQLVDKHYINIYSNDSITNFGNEVNNINSFIIFNDSGDEVTINYLVNLETGTLSIFKKEIVVETASNSFIYNALNQYDHSYILKDELVNGEEVFNIEYNSFIDVNNYKNNLTIYIKKANEEDSTPNYDFEYIVGNISILPRPITIKPEDLDKIYDDEVLSTNGYLELPGEYNLIAPHQLFIITDGRIIDVDLIDNSIISHEIYDGNIDISFNYDVSYEKGTLRIDPRPIVIVPTFVEKMYDGFELTSNLIEYDYSSTYHLVNNHTFSNTNSGRIINVGTKSNIIDDIKIFKDELDVTSNYDITKIEGLLEITKRPILIKPTDKTKVYDAKYFFSSKDEYDILSELQLVLDHYLEIETDLKVKDANLYNANSIIASTIYNQAGIDLTYNYEISTQMGILEILKREVIISTYDHAKEYDGIKYSNQGYYIHRNSLYSFVDDHIVNDELITNLINVGSDTNEVIITDILEDNISVNHNYIIIYQDYGTLTITKRNIEVTIFNNGKTYDDTNEIKATNFDISEGSLVLDHLLTLILLLDESNYGNRLVTTYHGSIDSGFDSVTSNYNIKYYLEGNILINKKDIELKLEIFIHQYDGTEVSSNKLTYDSLNQLIDQHTILVTTNSKYTNVGTHSNIIDSFIIRDSNGIDVTNNYNNKEYLDSLFFITERPITIKPTDLKKNYDGTKLTSKEDDVEVTSELSLVLGHYILIKVDGAITDKGTIENNITEYEIFDSNNNDVTSNYNVSKEFGYLTIADSEITFILADVTKVYDGEALTSNKYTILNNDGFSSYIFKLNTSGEITNVGSVTNELISVEVFDNEGNLVNLDNFKFLSVPSTLTINKRTITIGVVDETVTYNGDEQFSNTPLYISNHSYSIVEGHIAILDTYSFKNVGIYTNHITDTKIYIGSVHEDNDVTDNYDIKTESGTFTISKLELDIMLKDTDKVYDGNSEFNNVDYLVTSNNLPSSETMVINIIVSNSNAINGKTVEKVNIYVTDTSNVLTNGNYSFQVTQGIFNIKKREITVKPEDIVKEYDGLEFTTNKATIVEGSLSLVLGDTITVNSNSFVDANTHYNEISYHNILDSNGQNINDNYDVYYEEGITTILKRNVEIEIISKEKVYDGTILISNEFKVTKNYFVLDHVLFITTTGEALNVNNGVLVDNELDSFIVSSNNNDYSHNYNIKAIPGTLEITPRNITIETGSSSKIYDGLNLTNDNYFITGLEYDLAPNQTLDARTIGDITNVGLINNELSINGIFSSTEDVTSNYLITILIGSLQIFERKITIKPVDETKVYDGTTLTSILGEVTPSSSNTLVDLHTIKIVSKSITNVKKINNQILSYSILDENEEEVTSNYLVYLEQGILEITLNEITLNVEYLTKVYDGNNIFNNFEFVISKELNEVVTFEILVNNSNIGNKTIQERIVNISNGLTNTTSNYSITSIIEGLEITTRDIEIKPLDKEKIYDGFALTSNKALVTNSSLNPLVEGDYIVITTDGSFTDYGSYTNNIVTLYIYDAKGNDVTSNYDVTIIEGLLVITKIIIHISQTNWETTYDGSVKVNTNFKYEDSSPYRLLEGHIINLIVNDNFIDAGTYLTSIDTYTIMDGNKDITDNYDVVVFESSTVIKPREITVKSYSDTKIYDGESLEKDGIYISSNEPNNLVLDHQIKATLTGSQTVPGTSNNTFTDILIFTSNNIDVTKNYLINKEEGILEVTKRPITIGVKDETKIYDGQSLTSETVIFYNVNNISLLEKHTISITSKSITNVGSITNIIESYIIFEDQINVTDYYIVSLIDGTLEITKQVLEISVNDIVQTYNGSNKFIVTDPSYFNIESGYIASDDFLTINVLLDDSVVGLRNILQLDLEISNITNLKANNNYHIIRSSYGSFEIVKSDIEIKPVDILQAFTGKDISAKQGDITITSPNRLAPGHYIVIESDEKIKYVKTADSYIKSYIIYNQFKEVVTDNYNVTNMQTGTITIRHREITINLVDESKVYDGKELVNDNNHYNTDNSRDCLILDHLLSITTEGSITDVGSTNSKITNISIIDKDTLEDYKEYYIFTTNEGTLTITHRNILISIDNKSKEYDGLKLTSGVYDYEVIAQEGYHTLTADFTLEITTTSSIINIGKITNNKLNTHIFLDSEGNDKSDNFKLEASNEGILEVTPRKVHLITNTDSKTYDNKEFNYRDYIVLSGSFVPDEEVIVEKLEEFINAGKYENILDVYVLDNNEGNNNYDVTIEYGLIEIFKRNVTFKTSDYEAFYTGESISHFNGYFTKGTSLAQGDNYQPNEFDQGFIDVGDYDNEFEIEIYDYYTREDKSSNYNITYEYGVLTIKPHRILIRIDELVLVYNNSIEFKNVSYLLVENSLTYIPNISIDIYIDNKNVGTRNLIEYKINFDNPDNIQVDIEKPDHVEVIPKDLSIYLNDSIKTYNGEYQFTNDFDYSYPDNIFTGHTLNIITTARLKNVGSIINEIENYIILDEDGNNISDNYHVILDETYFQVIPLDITIKAKDAIKNYDGYELTSNEVEFLDPTSLVQNQVIFISTDSAIINSGITNNNIIPELTYILDEYNNNVTNNYNITYLESYLVVRYDYQINLSDKGTIYTGEDIGLDEDEYKYYIESGYELRDGDTLVEVITSKTEKEVGTYCIGADVDGVVISDSFGNDVTWLYNITIVEAILTIMEVNIGILTNSITGKYNGEELSDNGFEMIYGNLLVGHRIKLSYETYVSEVGVYENKATITAIYDKDGNDVKRNYSVLIRFGTITIY